MQKRQIQAVLFDYGMVLSASAYPPAWARMKVVYGADEAAFYPLYWKFRHAYDRGDIGGYAYWQAIADELDKALTQEDMAELLDADVALWTQPNQPMIDWAARLLREGIKTGLLSNLGDVIEPGILAVCPWLNDFTHHTFSHRLNIAKPEPEIYHHAARGLGVPVEDIFFIDDREENTRGAEAVGMQAIQYTGHEAFVATMEQHGLRWLLDI